MHSKRCIEASFSSYPALKLVTVGCTVNAVRLQMNVIYRFYIY